MPTSRTSPYLTTGPRLLRLPAVLAQIGLGRSRLYDLVSRGDFPRPVKLSDRAIAWHADEVSDWIQARPRAHA